MTMMNEWIKIGTYGQAEAPWYDGDDNVDDEDDEDGDDDDGTCDQVGVLWYEGLVCRPTLAGSNTALGKLW